MRFPIVVLAALVFVSIAGPLGGASSANGVPCQSDAAPLGPVGTGSGHVAPAEVDDYNIHVAAHSIVAIQAAYTQAVLHTLTIRFSSWIDGMTCQLLCEGGSLVTCQPRQSGNHTISIVGRGSPGGYTFAWEVVALPAKLPP